MENKILDTEAQEEETAVYSRSLKYFHWLFPNASGFTGRL